MIDELLGHRKFARDAKPMIPEAGIDVLLMMDGQYDVKDGYFVVKGEPGLKTERTFQPPIEIEYILITDGQVRLSCAACEMIFNSGENHMILNWGKNPSDLRLDGGPIRDPHRPNAGRIPIKQLISLKVTVQPDQMIVAVDGRERARWEANFKGVNEPIGISAPHNATVQVKQVTVRNPR